MMDESLRKKILIGVSSASAGALIIIVGLFFLKGPTGLPGVGSGVSDDGARQSAEAAKETQKLIDEVKSIANEVKGGKGDSIAQVVMIKKEGAGTSTAEEAVVVAPGSNPISVATGDVLTEDGDKAANNVEGGTPEAPHASEAVKEEQLPESTVKITMTPTGVTPPEFTVKPGQAVSLAVTAGPSAPEIFRFEDESLRAVAFGLGPSETRTISFNAPGKAGEYIFFSDIGGHRNSGAVGKMIVK